MSTQCAIAKQILLQKASGQRGSKNVMEKDFTLSGYLIYRERAESNRKKYVKMIETTRSHVEIREYYQKDQINWMKEYEFKITSIHTFIHSRMFQLN